VLLHLLVSTVLRGRWNLDMQLPPHYPRRIRSPPSFKPYYREAEGQLSTCNLTAFAVKAKLRETNRWPKAR
jgi:hypothetical protein